MFKTAAPHDVRFAQQIVATLNQQNKKASSFYQNSLKVVVEWNLQQLSETQLHEVVSIVGPTLEKEKVQDFPTLIRAFEGNFGVLDQVILYVQSLSVP